MANYILLSIFLSLILWGCSGEFWGGAGTGALATGGGYEATASRQMHKLRDDFRSGKIDRREYATRKRQIERGSILY
ncbi:MAG: hypothetical protein HY695_20235 [Deltaproteobacteria bacterium]|nr:hypothetical protein [Deltaproteobacteria bacterium]